MKRSRRKFLQKTSTGLILAASTRISSAEQPPPLAGAPPAFNTSPAVGREVSSATFSEAEKLVQVTLTEPQRAMAAENWRTSMAAFYERRTGPRRVALESTLAPGSQWNPELPGISVRPVQNQFVRSNPPSEPLPADDRSIAYAPVTQLANWIEKRQLTSERLTNIYLERLDKFNPQLRCVITLTREQALAQAKKADREIAAGHYRGPLHGIPWGGKDLLDTAGIPSTYGAEFFRNRIRKKMQPSWRALIGQVRSW